MTEVPTHQTQLTIIGTGLAGLAAAWFSFKNGISTTLVGVNSSLIYASGFFDLLSVHPAKTKQTWENPWRAIEQLVKDNPEHPYGHLSQLEIESALEQFFEFVAEAGCPYVVSKNKNTKVITPVGTVKLTYAVPRSMWSGTVALAEKRSCLIVDFKGLKAFSARQIVDMLQPDWPQIRPLRLSFPAGGPSADLYPEQMARSLEIETNRVKLADLIRPALGNAKVVGLPAILGIYNPRQVREHLEELLGVDIFEIPTNSP